MQTGGGVDRTPVSLRATEHLHRIRVLVQPRGFVTRCKILSSVPRRACALTAGRQESNSLLQWCYCLQQDKNILFILMEVLLKWQIQLRFFQLKCVTVCIKLFLGSNCQIVVSKVLKPESLCG